MFIIVGLGNPGRKYKKTRHNAGFTALDFLHEKYKFPKWKQNKKMRSEISEGEIAGQKTILLKPQTYMNKSGEAIKATISYYKPASTAGRRGGDYTLIAIYDDIDLPFEKIRLKSSGSSGGHNGIKSIIDSLGTDEFIRIKLGIANEHSNKVPAKKFVLSKISRAEWKILTSSILPKVSDATEMIINQDIHKAQALFN